jgi:hypothetical protein
MKFMSGWTWYCEYHDSFGIGDSELEVQYTANAHMRFHIKSRNPCQLTLKNQSEPEQGSRIATLAQQDIEIKPQNYVDKVKENFSRAWKRWDAAEDAKLKELFDTRQNLSEMTRLHQRAEGGIFARLKKLNLLGEDVEFKDAADLLENNHEKLIKKKTYSSPLKVVAKYNETPQVTRGKDSFEEFGMINPPPMPLPDLRHTSLFKCSICSQPVIGNSCYCRNN